MDKIEKMQFRLARERKAEIARKVKAQGMQNSGYVKSQMSSLTSIDKLIECDHYMLKGKKAALSHAKDARDKAKKELKEAMPSKHKHVKRHEGKTVGVQVVYTDK